ncbi:hypothetical protein ACF1BU_19640 [Streptomyces sp. NPDC014724]|uniref:hypothetical protein n=1 Tax=unclassified Streptomyces TaxID=2593676 RepID=UPI0036F57EF7
MRTNKAFAVLCSALFAGSLAFVPAATPQASAAPKPAQTVAANEILLPYADGYRHGFRDGFADAQDDCARRSGEGLVANQSLGERWAQGYADGYDQGYSQGFDRFC